MDDHIIWRPIKKIENAEELAVPDLDSLFKLWRDVYEDLRESEVYKEFQNKWLRSWSIETGILERIYNISPSLTETLINEGFKASVIAHDNSISNADKVIAILKDHLFSNDFVLDIVKGNRQFSTSWIKELHRLLVDHQSHSSARNVFGQKSEIPLIKGDWKKFPNNPRRENGQLVVYCPPEQVASEMENLIKFYYEIPSDYPEVRAAWLHHRFTQIHPFQDGNGRVARCLANIDFIKAGGFPVLIKRDHRDSYIHALEEADKGDLKPLVVLFASFQKDGFLKAISLAQEELQKYKKLDVILDAVKTKLEQIRKSNRDRTDILAQDFHEYIEIYLKNQAINIEKKLRNSIPELKVYSQKSTINESHFYSHQLTDISEKAGYSIDFSTSRYWNKLCIRDGRRSDIVFVNQQVGRPSRGVAVIISFIEFLDTDDVGFRKFLQCSIEPFVLTYQDSLEVLEDNFKNWLETSFLTAMAEWQRNL